MNRIIGFLFLALSCFVGCTSQEPSYDKEFADFFINAPAIDWKINIDSLDEVNERLYRKIKRPSNLDSYRYYSRKSWCCRAKGKWEKGLVYTDSMLAELTPLHAVEDEYVKTLNIRGAILRARHMYDEALKQLYAAKVFTENAKDPCDATNIYLNLGTILYQKENYEESLKQYLWIIETLSHCPKDVLYPYVYNLNGAFNAAGLCHEQLGNYDSSYYYYQKSLAFLKMHAPNFPEDAEYFRAAMGVTLGNLGFTYMMRGNYDSAELILQGSIDQNLEDPHLKEDVLFTKIKLIRLYTRAKEYEKAKALVEEIETGDFITANSYMRLQEVKHELYSNLGNVEKAYAALTSYHRTRDSISIGQKELLPINLTETYTYLSQKEQIRELEEAEQERGFYLLIAVISVLALLIIAYLIRRNLIESKRHLKALSEVNKEILLQHDQLESTLKALEKSHHENKRLMKVLAHDLRSPVAGMVSLADLLKDSERLNEEESQAITMIEKIGKDSLEMMENILDLKEVLPEQTKTEVEFYELLTYCVALMQLRASEKKQKIQLKGVKVKVPMMRDQVWRAVNNILNNAIKFSPQGTRIYVELKKTESTALLSIRDEGIGISDKLSENLFSVVDIAQRSGTDGEKTFGLGLPLAKRVMDLHGGTIWMESEEGKGATFYLEFPLK